VVDPVVPPETVLVELAPPVLAEVPPLPVLGSSVSEQATVVAIGKINATLRSSALPYGLKE